MPTTRFPAARPLLALLCAAAFAVAGCGTEEPAENHATAPSDRQNNEQQAQVAQDSLLRRLDPGHIAAVVSGDANNPDSDAVFSGEGLRGALAVDSSARTAELQFSMERSDTAPGRLRIVLRPDTSGDAASGRNALRTALRSGGTYHQEPGRPSVEALLYRGRNRYPSRSGTLTLRRTDAGRTEGRFSFETQRPGASSEDNWFEVSGVFLTEGAAGGPGAAS